MSGTDVTLEDIPGLLDESFAARYAPEPFLWPGEKPVAVVVAVVVEYFRPSRAALYAGGPSIVSAPIPAGAFDFMNWSWRAYGNRVGLWRLLDVLSSREIPVSAITNAKLHEVYPEITSALQAAGWDLHAAHGLLQDQSLLEFVDDPSGQREYLRDSLQAHERFTGVRATGWLSPAGGLLPESFGYLAAEGIEWIGAFQSDDRPFRFRVGERDIVAMPHTTDLTDYHIFTSGHQPPAVWEAAVLDTADVLSGEGRASRVGRVMVISAHPHVMGQPSRVRHFAELLDRLRGRDDLWWASQHEIASHFREQTTSHRP